MNHRNGGNCPQSLSGISNVVYLHIGDANTSPHEVSINVKVLSHVYLCRIAVYCQVYAWVFSVHGYVWV